MNSVSFPPTIDELKEELSDLQDWDERYQYLIDLGRQLPALPVEQQTKDHLVQGCMSTVWLVARFDGAANSKRMTIAADSDSLIVKGLIVVLMAIFDHRTCEDVLAVEPEITFKEFGLDQHLSPQRRNGLFAMVQRIKQLAAVACTASG